MKKARTLFFIFALCCLQTVAQQDIYVTVKEDGVERTSLVRNVDRMACHDQQVDLYAGEAMKTYAASSALSLGFSEHEAWSGKVFPAEYRKDFDFDISFLPSDASLAGDAEPECVDPEERDYDDMVEHATWDKSLTITFNGETATVSGAVEGVEVTVVGAHVTVHSTAEGVAYTLKGQSDDGSFKIHGEKKAKLVLAGLKLHNPKGPAVNNQSKKRLFVCLAEGAENSLSDGETYDKAPAGEDQRGCLFSEGQLCISGLGALSVEGHKKGGIASDEYIHMLSGFVKVACTPQKGKGVYAKKHFIMGGGALQVLCEGDVSKAVCSDSLITVRGGKMTLVTTGDAIYDEEKEDYSACTSLKCDRDMNLLGGEVRTLATGSGGKGISAGETFEETDSKGKTKEVYKGKLTIDGAKIYVRTTGPRIPAVKKEDAQGNKVGAAASPKGMKSADDITVKSGEIYVRCSGGAAAEGIESKKHVRIDGGKIRSYCVDDGMNASGAYINGGDIFLCSSENDGFDVGFLYMYDGALYTIGGPGDQMGLDTDGKTFVINAGSIKGIGARNCSPYAKSQQVSVLVYLKKSVSRLAIVDSEGTELESVMTPDFYNPIGVLVSSGKLELGQTYRILSYAKDGAEPVEEYTFTPETTSTTLGKYK